MRHIIILVFCSLWLFASDATIDVIKESGSLPSIVVEDATVDFRGESTSKKFAKVLQADLNVLALFNVDTTYHTADYDSDSVEDSSKNYTLRFRLSRNDRGTVIVDAKLIRDKESVMSRSYRVDKESMSVFLAHSIAYDVNAYFGQESVEWMKRKLVISRLVGKKQSEIVIADYTLTYQHVIIKGGLNVFARWADEKHNAIYYTSLSTQIPTLYRVNIKTGKKELIATSDGMLVCSDVSRDGKKLLLTMAPNGQPDIYLFDTITKKKRRVTTYSGIDVNGQFLGDGRVVFVSNRLGYPNIFAKNIGQRSVEQMVYYGRNNSASTAHNEYIIYKSRESDNAYEPNTFNLHLISTKSDFVRRLTATGDNEFARFSQNGKVVMYVKNYLQESAIGIIRLEQNKNFLFPLKGAKIQSLDW